MASHVAITRPPTRAIHAARGVRVSGLQRLRAIAATLVVVDHLVFAQDRQGWLPWSWADYASIAGYVGVCAFFVTSGFIMVRTASAGFGSPRAAGLFAVRRVIRIVPLYWIATFMAAHLELHRPDFVAHLLKSLLFVPYVDPGGDWQPLLGVGWTLNFEMAFYALFALSMLLPRRIGLGACLAVLTTFGAAGFVPGLHGVLRFYADPIVLLFGIGMVLGLVLEARGRLLPPLRMSTIALTALAAGVPVVCFALRDPILLDAFWHVVYTAVATALVLIAIAGVPARPAVVDHALVTAGDGSYSTYLFHGFLLAAFVEGWTAAGLPVSPVAVVVQVVAVIAVANVAGVLIHRISDRVVLGPLDRLAKQRLLPRDAVPASAG